MKLICPNKKCKYEWDYNGKAPFYTSCPRCKGQVRTTKKPKRLKGRGEQ